MQQYFPPVSAIQSTLYEISSSHSKEKDPKHGNGHFTCAVHNASKVTQAIKIIPVKTWVPNIQGNINRHTETILLIDSVLGTLTQSVVISRGFYSQVEYVALLNASFAGVIEFAVSLTERDRLTIKQIAVATDLVIVASVDWFEMVGFKSLSTEISPSSCPKDSAPPLKNWRPGSRTLMNRPERSHLFQSTISKGITKCLNTNSILRCLPKFFVIRTPKWRFIPMASCWVC